MLDRIRDLLVCPLCRTELGAVGTGLSCSAGHSFDAARQGYVNLASAVGRPPVNADDAGMVGARETFLSAGHFAPLAAAIAVRAGAGVQTVLDAGAGTGYYLAAVLDRCPAAVGLAVDSSPAALRRAARAHPRAGAIGWDLRLPLPVRDAAVDLVLNVFAPREAREYARVLSPDGTLLVVTPGPRHLAELVEALGLIGVDPDKPARLAAGLDPYFEAPEAEPLEFVLALTRAEAAALALMSPSAHHLTHGQIAERTAALPDLLAVTASVTISCRRLPVTAADM